MLALTTVTMNGWKNQNEVEVHIRPQFSRHGYARKSDLLAI